MQPTSACCSDRHINHALYAGSRARSAPMFVKISSTERTSQPNLVNRLLLEQDQLEGELTGDEAVRWVPEAEDPILLNL